MNDSADTPRPQVAPSSQMLRDFAESAKRPALRVLSDDVSLMERGFYEMCDGNVAEFALARRQSVAAAVAQLRDMAIISGRDIRYVAATVAAGLRAPWLDDASIQLRFRAMVAELGAIGLPSLPGAMRLRFSVALRLAQGDAATPSQIAVAADAIAHGLDRGGDRRRALIFALLSGEASDAIVGGLTRADHPADVAIA